MSPSADCPDEEILARYLRRARAGNDAGELDAHLAECTDCRRLLFAFACDTLGGGDAGERPSDDRPRTLGRYLLEDLIGAGGMGLVFSATDPALRRRVAIKVLRRSPTAADTAQLLGEARALARLSHPNVVTVHDVGEEDGEIFLAMEALDGRDLDAWRRERPRAWREVITAMVAAGEGLAAAHRAGLVHRDVKPANVRVTGDGRVCLADFGLAAPSAARPERGPDPEAAASPSTPVAGSTGQIAGTPVYMAPEVRAGGRADVRSDLFSFCTTLFEALFEARPFADGFAIGPGAAPPALELPRRPRLPRRIAALLRRGLAIDPAARPASMADVLGVLRRELRLRRRAQVAAAAALVAAAVGGAALVAAARDQPCRGAADGMAAVWSGARRAELGRAILATGQPYAEDSWRRVGQILDGYADRWAALRRQTCRATNVDRTQSTELLDRQMTCLDRRLRTLEIAVAELSRVEASSAANAISIAASLPSLTSCADADTLLAIVPLPDDPARRAQVDQAHDAIARAEVLAAAGRLPEARVVASRAVELARAASHPPVEAAAERALASIHDQLYEHDRARECLQRALAAAGAAGDLRQQVQILAALAVAAGKTSADRQVALEHARHARGLLERLGDDPELAASVHLSLAGALMADDPAKARVELERGLAALERLPPDDDFTRVTRANYVLREAGLEIDPSATLPRLEAARRALVEAFGPDHPRVGELWEKLAYYHFFLGQIDEARAAASRAAELLGSIDGARTMLMFVTAYVEPDLEERLRLWHQALPEAERRHGRHADLVGMILFELAKTLVELDRWAEAEPLAERSQAIDEARGVAEPDMVEHHLLRVFIEVDRKDLAAAEVAASRAAAIARAHDRRDSLALAELALADIRFDQGRYAESLALLERGEVGLREMVPAGDSELVKLEFLTAACRWELGQGRAGALARARAARARLAEDRTVTASSLRQMDTWLQRRR